MKPKVTIGICARNCEDFVGFAIQSINKQAFPHELMEIIFVDDGSDDKTAEVAENNLSETNITWRIFANEWQGLGRSRNFIVHKAKGDYIIWVDGDETLSSDFVQKQIHKISQNPKAGIVAGKLKIPEGERLVCVLDLIPLVVEYSRQDWRGETKFPGTGGTAYRVQAAIQAGGFDEELSGLGEDIEIASRIRDAGWLILPGEGVFFESHSKLSSWIELLKKSFYQGIQARRLHRKTSRFYSISRINPFASAIAGCLYAVEGYKATRRKIVFLLPFHFSIKMLLWFCGFSNG